MFKRTVCIISASILLLLGFSISAQNLRVGVYSNSPKIFIDSRGNPAGVFIDLLEYIARQENWELSYVIDEWSVLVDAVSEGNVDILPDVAYSESRARNMLFSQINVVDDWLQVFALQDSGINTLADLDGTSIAVLQGSMQEEYLSGSFRESFGYNFSLHSHADYYGTAQAVLLGTADVLVASRFFSFSPERDSRIVPTTIVFRPSVTLFAFSKDIDSEIPLTIDAHMAALQNDPYSVYYRSLDTWFAPPRSMVSRVLIVLLLVSAVLLLIMAVFVPVLRMQVKRSNAELLLANANLKESLEEREKLLRELYHRTRNNMQIICAMLNLQAAQQDSEILSDAFASAQGRIQAMAIVHESMLEAENLHCLAMYDFIRDLVEMVRSSDPQNYSGIKADIDVPDIPVNMDNALPLGLVLNELLSNSFRHAFVQRSRGDSPEISIRMINHPADASRYSIVYQDNGIGIQDIEAYIQPSSLGLQLIHSIAESQLGADVLFERRQGMYVRIEYVYMQQYGCTD
ncbi:sensor histidine kinase [Spirochaeta dissipatitropha]